MDVYSERRSTYSIHMQAACCCVSVTMVWVWRWSVMDMNTTANVIGGYKGKFHCQSCSKTVFSTQLMQTKQLIQRPSSVSIASSVAYTYIYIDGAPPSKQNQNICLPLHLAIRQTACTHHTLKCARARSLSLSLSCRRRLPHTITPHAIRARSVNILTFPHRLTLLCTVIKTSSSEQQQQQHTGTQLVKWENRDKKKRVFRNAPVLRSFCATAECLQLRLWLLHCEWKL